MAFFHVGLVCIEERQRTYFCTLVCCAFTFQHVPVAPEGWSPAAPRCSRQPLETAVTSTKPEPFVEPLAARLLPPRHCLRCSPQFDLARWSWYPSPGRDDMLELECATCRCLLEFWLHPSSVLAAASFLFSRCCSHGGVLHTTNSLPQGSLNP